VAIKVLRAIYRGGTSEPIFYVEDELLKDPKKRDTVIAVPKDGNDYAHWRKIYCGEGWNKAGIAR